MNCTPKDIVASKLILHENPEILQREKRYMLGALRLPIICITSSDFLGHKSYVTEAGITVAGRILFPQDFYFRVENIFTIM